MSALQQAFVILARRLLELSGLEQKGDLKMNRLKTSGLAGLWTLVLGLVLCCGSVAGQVTQAQMIEDVRSELIKLPYYTVFDYLEYKVDGRTVTLSGAVTRPMLKRDAEAAVHDVKGVEEVVNNIKVLPPSTADDRIRQAVYRAVYGSGGLQKYALGANPSIRIIVENGNVTLEGVVANEMDKNVAGVRAKSVGGTFKVTNNLIVESDAAKAE